MDLRISTTFSNPLSTSRKTISISINFSQSIEQHFTTYLSFQISSNHFFLSIKFNKHSMNYFYNKAITYEFDNDPTIIKVSIINNTTTCTHPKIKTDIEQKVAEMKINTITFYTSLYDYELIDPTNHYIQLNKLPTTEFPIYHKAQPITEFFDWYKTHFNNNSTDVYETSKFTKRITHSSDQTKCLKSVAYEITNPKFHNFNQLFFHAGDNADLQRYGILYTRSIFKFKIAENIPPSSVTPQKINNTLDYMFNYMKKGILVGIKSNKLALFLPFSKHDYQNDYYDELYFNADDKQQLTKFKKGIISDKKQLFNAVYSFYNKNHLQTKGINPDRTKWVANDCFFRNEFYEGDKNEALYENLFSTLCEERVLPDCIFFLNLRDHPMLRKDGKHTYDSITNKDIPEPYFSSPHAPILSAGASDEHDDVAMVTQDDWLRITQLYFPDDCKNGYTTDTTQQITTVWKNKKDCAIFRGSATGCGITEETNMRIKASALSLLHPSILDAGLTSFNRKIKKRLHEPITLVDTSRLKKYEKPFINNQYKSTFKYILTIDGHVSAFRLGYEFSLGSVILLPMSKFYLWFSDLLIPFTHYIPIKHDLSDLIEQIEWCKANDSKCEIIAQNGLDLYKRKLCRDGALDYMQKKLEQITLYSLPPSEPPADGICIIVPYRNNNRTNERLHQKRQFVYFMNKLLKNYGDNEYAILIVEQTDGEPFNAGKVRNIGFDYFDKIGKRFDNYIFTDVDMLPDDDLMEYYFKPTDGLNGLAIRGTRYNEKRNPPFVGGVVSCSYSVFKQINGYSLLFSRGWGGEDDGLVARCAMEHINIYLPKKGAVIDLEGKRVEEKMSELKQNHEIDNKKWEFLAKFDLYKNDGLSNMKYKVVEELNSADGINYHIVVDLLQKEHERENKEQYDVSGFKKEDYDEFVRVAKTVKVKEF